MYGFTATAYYEERILNTGLCVCKTCRDFLKETVCAASWGVVKLA